MKSNAFCFIFVLLLRACVSHGSSVRLSAYLSGHGVKGEVRFEMPEKGEPTVVTVNIQVTEGREGDYMWGIYQFPIDYTQEDYCHSRFIGRRPQLDLEEYLGKLVLPLEEPLVKQTVDIPVVGVGSVWGSSLVLEGPNRRRICATITPDMGAASLKVLEARFTAPVAGSVFFHSLTIGSVTETKILSNLYHVVQGSSTDHTWSIFITDILGTNKKRQSCNFLQIIFDPDNKDTTECSKDHPENCRAGDLTKKFGKVRVGKKKSVFTKKYFTDTSLSLPKLTGARSLYLSLYDAEHPDSFFACAKIQELKPRVAHANLMQEGVAGIVAFTQISPFHPVNTKVKLTGLAGIASSYHIHQLPIPPKLTQEDIPCSSAGPHYNPRGVEAASSPPPQAGSVDQYEGGDLSGKYGDLRDRREFAVAVVDPGLSLFGARSVVGRSLVIHKKEQGEPWVCATIDLHQAEMMTAVAKFTYPIAGKIIFRQERDNPLADTHIYVEGLLYSDGTKNNTNQHKWHVHRLVPGKDFFNWTGRCLSAGRHFNPYKINMEERLYRECVNEKTQSRCEVGDLYSKHGALTVAGRKRDISTTKMLFTDTNLPLSGSGSIVGRSIVIHDDKAPEHRGDRMACTPIRRLYRHKAVARDWFGNGIAPPVSGRLEFIQDTSMSLTHTLVQISGLASLAESYHVHEVSIQPQLEFPCTGDAVGGHLNPWTLDKATSPKPAAGTPDQYEVGDLSGKYGVLRGKKEWRNVYNDTNLSLFGSHSILGRSIVIHKRLRSERWACASIGWGYDPDEATQVTSIASFHHPNGYAWGYIRFSQVVYKDGSSTETTIHVRLKYPGKNNNDHSSGHDWSIYVNPVHHDAAIRYKLARCTAAGYRWNPTHIQLADPNDHGFYSEECGPDTPIRCQVGDLSGRHGKISVGSRSSVFSDDNLALSGDWYSSAVGKSIVIHGPEGSSERMACANIEPDKDIIKYAVIKTLPGFNLANFMENVQGVMGVPDWFLFTDSRETKVLHQGKCLQILLHFRGPYANQLEQDFSRLMRTGKLASPSLAIPGYVFPNDRKTKLEYRECGSSRDRTRELYGLNSSGKGNKISGGAWIFIVIVLLLN